MGKVTRHKNIVPEVLTWIQDSGNGFVIATDKGRAQHPSYFPKTITRFGVLYEAIKWTGKQGLIARVLRRPLITRRLFFAALWLPSAQRCFIYQWGTERDNLTEKLGNGLATEFGLEVDIKLDHVLDSWEWKSADHRWID